MTNNIARWMGRTAAVLTSMLFLTGLCHAQMFSFNVPVNNPAIAVVKVTLEGAGNAKLTASGSNPSINGGAVFQFNNGNAFGAVDGLVTDSLNDIIRVDAISGNLVIQYIRNGHFDTSNTGAPDYCSAKPNAAQSETINFSLTVSTSSAYRMNSYTVPASQGVSAVDCSKAKRRVSAGAAWITPPPGVDHERHPLDVVLVLDKSGSMGTQDVQIGQTNTNETRMQALKDAAGEFVAHLGQADPDGTEGADRLAVVFYSSTTDPATPAGINFITRASGNWPNITATIQGTTEGGSTAMGEGIQVAVDGWKQSGANTNFDDATLVLLTDGLQNTGPQVTACQGTQNLALNPGCGPSTTCTPAGLAELYLCGIPMETLALSPAADHALVDTISQQTAGISKQALTSTDLSNSFADSLVDLLKGNSESILFRAEDTFTPSGGGGQLRQTLVDGSVKRAIFVLGWQGLRTQNALDLQIFPPGCTPPGCKPVSPVMRTDGPFWTVQSVDIPSTGPIGNWSVQVVQRQVLLTAAGGVVVPSTGIPYHLSAYSIDGKLSYRIAFAGIGQGTGDSIALQAQVSYLGKPLTGLGNALKVHVERPNTGEGTYLHDTQVPDAVLSTEPDPGDVTTPYERKILYLAKNGKLKNIIQPQPIPTDYVLLDNGDAQNGDIAANDGVYSGKIADTSRPGLYRFTVTLDWDVPTTGKIHRIEILERNIKVNATADASEVTVTKGSTPGQWLIGVTPRDRFGNYTGPGFGNSFDVQVTGGGALSGGPADGKETGAYILTLTGVPADTDPNVIIRVQGKEIRNGKLSTIGKARRCSGLFGAALFPLPVGILLLGVLVYWPRRKNKA